MTRTGGFLIPAAVFAALLAGCGDTGEQPAAQPSGFSLVDELETTPASAPTLPTYPPPDAGPLAIFGGDGTYVVGVDILPGTYRAQGPSTEGGSCYWSRLSDTTGDFDAIIANGGSQGPVTLTVKESDAAVQTSGCTGWAKVG